MLQILIWAVCGLLIGIGYCGQQLVKIHKEKGKSGEGDLFLIFMLLIAIIIFYLSVRQGINLSAITNQFLP